MSETFNDLLANLRAKNANERKTGLTHLGRTLRDWRLLRNELLYDMANAVNVGTAELSGYECARAPIPADVADRIRAVYAQEIEEDGGIFDLLVEVQRLQAKKRNEKGDPKS